VCAGALRCHVPTHESLSLMRWRVKPPRRRRRRRRFHALGRDSHWHWFTPQQHTLCPNWRADMGAAGSCTGNDAQPAPRSVFAASSPTSSISSKYSANRQIVAAPSARPPPKPPADGDTADHDGAFEPGKVQNLAFIKSVNAVDTRRDYSIIVDRSGSMAGDRWREVRFGICTILTRSLFAVSDLRCLPTLCQAQAAVEFLVPHVCRCDPDGISLYFFNGHFDKFENIATPQEVMEKFQEYEPGGGTKLSKVCQLPAKYQLVHSALFSPGL
jgi:hypothetical protein